MEKRRRAGKKIKYILTLRCSVKERRGVFFILDREKISPMAGLLCYTEITKEIAVSG